MHHHVYLSKYIFFLGSKSLYVTGLGNAEETIDSLYRKKLQIIKLVNFLKHFVFVVVITVKVQVLSL